MKKNILLLVLVLLQVVVYGRKDKAPDLRDQNLSFRENKGQIRDQKGAVRKDIDFIMQTPDMTLFIGKGQLHYQFIKREQADTSYPVSPVLPKTYRVPGAVSMHRLDVNLINANEASEIVREQPQQEKYHYYNSPVANDEGTTGVLAYKKITYRNIYPNIDWVLYAKGKNLKYDFIVRPGGKVSDIGLQYTGATSMELARDGSLHISVPIGSLTEDAPYLYESGSKKNVPGSYILKDNIVSFKAGAHSGTLVIDPGVDWATYFGGGEGETGTFVTTDPEGNVYITGLTNSLSNLATTGAHQTVFSGSGNDAFLAKFDSLGQLQWATYYGGTLSAGFFITTQGYSISCDIFGHVYLTGITSVETGISTPGSYQPNRGANSFFQGYLAQFNSDGIRNWGTYYGASLSTPAFLANVTSAYASACDKEGNVYIGCNTDSMSSTTGTLVTAGAHQTIYGGGGTDGLLVKFDSSGNREWATYYGGENYDYLYTLVCDDSNNVYLSGISNSPAGIATPGTHESVIHENSGGFVAKFNSAGVRQWGSYLHGRGAGIALDPYNHLYVCGHVQEPTPDTMIITPGCHQSTLSINSQWNSFLLQLNPQNGTRNWGTYYGGSFATFANGVACDPYGNVYLTGETGSYSQLTTEAIATNGSHQDTLNADPGMSPPPYDAFIVQFDSTGARKWATYYGGPETDRGMSVTASPTGAIYVTGITQSTSAIATTGAHQAALSGTEDAFLVRLIPVDLALEHIVSPDNDTVCSGETPFSVNVMNQGWKNKTDTLFIHYDFSGPATGSLDTFFTGGLTAGSSDIYGLGNLDFPFPGNYQGTIYIRYTRDDNDRSNDTIHFELTATNALPVAEIEVSQIGTVFHFSNGSAQPSDQYLWDFGDGSTSTDANPSHQYSATDSYLVTLVVTGFCGSDTATMMIEGIGNNTGINHPEPDKSISIYPNPTEKNLFIKTGQGIIPGEYTITNALGQSVLNGSLQQKNMVNVSGLAQGSYFIRISTNKGSVSKQFQVLDQ
jgi:hypothetical protein